MGWFPDKDFRLVSGGVVMHKVNGKEHPNSKTQQPKEHTEMSDKNIRDLLEAIKGAIDTYLDDDAPATEKAAAKKRPAKSKAEPEPETDDDDDATDEDVEAELKKMSVPDLRKRAIAQGFEPDDVKGAKKADLIEAILEDLNGGDDDEDSDDDADDADDADDTDDDDSDDDADDSDDDEDDRRDELEGMSIAALRKLARSEPVSAKPAEVRTMDKEALIDLILDSEADDDSDSDMDGEPEDDDEDGYTRDELKAMSKEELLEIYAEWEIEPPAKKVVPALIKGILEAQ